MAYSEILKDPRWQKKRLEIIVRDNFTCQLCGDLETPLNVHHKEYVKGYFPWEYPHDTFITFCECCHSFVEKNKHIYGFELKDLEVQIINTKRPLQARKYIFHDLELIYVWRNGVLINSTYKILQP